MRKDSVDTKLVYTEFVKNVTISLPEDVLERLRDRAKEADKSLNAWLRDVLSREAGGGQEWFDNLMVTIDQISGPREPWTWNREDIYRERLDRYKPE